MEIIKATATHIPLVTPLLDQYRVFYKQSSDRVAAKQFLEDRFSRNQSIIFLALEENEPIGFVQLYTSYSSVTLQPVFILNDLFVIPTYRGKKVGETLLKKAKEFCRENQYKGLALETGMNNPAQKLYERLGWKKDTDCFHYFWTSK